MFNSKCIVVVTLLLFYCMHVPFCSCLCPFILSVSLFYSSLFFMFYRLLLEINHNADDDEAGLCYTRDMMQLAHRHSTTQR